MFQSLSNFTVIFTARRYAQRSLSYRKSVRLSVRPPVCLSGTLVD